VIDPDHFFRRLPQYVLSKKSWVKTPLKFFTSGVALIAAILFLLAKDELVGSGVTERSIYWYAVVTAVSAPILLPALCAFLLVLYAIAKVSPGLAPEWVLWELLIPLSPSTYARLKMSRFGWGALYFGVFFYIAVQVLVVLGNLELWILGDGLSQHSLLLMIPTVGFLAGLFLFTAWSLAMRPYIALLRQSVIIPTKHMRRSDCHLLKQALYGCEFCAARGRWKEIEDYLPTMRWLVRGYESILTGEDTRAKSLPPRYQQKLAKERAAVLGKMCSTIRLKALLGKETVKMDLLTELNALMARIDQMAKEQHHVADMRPDEPNELEIR
jgi:hypothetical protein